MLAACGVQGPPEPPRLERPEAVKDLQAGQVGRSLLVNFTPPELATDGERLTKPLEIEVLRAVWPKGATASAGGPSYQTWVTLDPAQWTASLRGPKVVLPIAIHEDEYRQWQGSTLTISVRTLTHGFRHRPIQSDLSNAVQVEVLDVSAPVEGLQIQATEKALELHWTPATRSLGGQALPGQTGYEVYRSDSAPPGDFRMLGETTEPEYFDRDFQFGHLYRYKVRALFHSGAQRAESDDSQVVEIVPKDIFPPAAPAGITAVYAGGAAELVWTPNREPDLAGYNVYRREGSEPAQRLNTDLLRTPVLRDTTVQPDRTYTYQITAVDLAGNEGERSAEATVETR